MTNQNDCKSGTMQVLQRFIEFIFGSNVFKLLLCVKYQGGEGYCYVYVQRD